MARVLEVLIPAILLVLGFNWLLGWRVRVATKSLREDNDRLREENTTLRKGESDELKELREECRLLHRMADNVMAAIARRPNLLELSGPYQPIIDIIASQRPERN